MSVLKLPLFKRGDVVRILSGTHAGTTGFVSGVRRLSELKHAKLFRSLHGSIAVIPDDCSVIVTFCRPAELKHIGSERLTRHLGGGRRTFERQYSSDEHSSHPQILQV
jgi:hypothetical protein